MCSEATHCNKCSRRGKHGHHHHHEDDSCLGPVVVNDGYDNECCTLIKRAYFYWTERESELIRETGCQLTRYADECKISRHEFQIRYSLFQISAQRLNRLLMYALKCILKRDDKAPCSNHGELAGCFDNDYCINATNLSIGAAMSTLKDLSCMAVNLALNRSAHQCDIRLALERVEDSFRVATTAEGCRDKGNFLPPLKCAERCGRF